MTDDAVASTSSVANQQLVVSESELENVVVKIEEGFPACVKGEGLPTLWASEPMGNLLWEINIAFFTER